jgi:transposase
MSNIQVTAFFQFCRVKVMEQTVEREKNSVYIKLRPDIRYSPLCSKCKERVHYIHSYNHRIVRDLNLIDARSYLSVVYRTVRCRRCVLWLKSSLSWIRTNGLLEGLLPTFLSCAGI